MGVFRTQGWSVPASTCVVQAQGSVDETTWFDLPASMSVTIAGNGLTYLPFTAAVPRYVRFLMTPAGGFDGEVEVSARSSSAIIAA